MGTEINHYEIIRQILSKSLKPPYLKEEIKAKIIGAIGGDDYVSSITAYLWGAYKNFDNEAKVAFKEIFFDDIKLGNPAAFYFFSFYFLNDFKRTGFDRRGDNDRREAYSIDFFSDKIVEKRRGMERRQDPEKRLDWTRVTKWVSVPFKVEAGDLLEDRLPQPDNYATNRTNFPIQPGNELPSLNVILSALIIYYERCIQQGQTDWLNSLDEVIFENAKAVMKNLIDIKKNES